MARIHSLVTLKWRVYPRKGNTAKEVTETKICTITITNDRQRVSSLLMHCLNNSETSFKFESISVVKGDIVTITQPI